MFKGKKAAFYTLGCKLNFSETSTIGRQLTDIGFKKTTFEDKADLYIINTCSVTENANRECRRIIRKAKKNSPTAFVAVTGCFAQLKPKEISRIEGVDMVLGASEKFNLPKLLKDLNTIEKTEIHGCEINDLDYFSSYSLTDRSRSFMKIQDGCDYPCTYCTIPLARGSSRCDSIKNIIKNAKNIASKGIKEIVITGVNIGEFKDKNNGKNFRELIKELDKVEGIERYRISSIEPNLITNEIIQFVQKSKKFMPHFHIPLQSGSDFILANMKRRYQSKLYINKITTITNEIKDVCIGADVIVGFPGETEKEFNKTINLIKKLPLSYLHVFTYSERENTPALNLTGVVDKQERANRSKRLRILSDKLQRVFYTKYINSQHTALFEQANRDGKLYGFTDNYIKVKVAYNPDLCQTKKRVILTEIDIDGIMKAEII
ncbi:tRNA (N(6)-L-threonylcarbamoyladenosine(37)-C(2))-methylthiotransferase MtaB [Flavobacteriales bacterium]|nr:tRNA (N(6)-L-threonylcarbamoyladenosine(37)-C(2))-methylthiotransferase MtaB [Flavobacteriales bacterium]